MTNMLVSIENFSEQKLNLILDELRKKIGFYYDTNYGVVQIDPDKNMVCIRGDISKNIQNLQGFIVEGMKIKFWSNPQIST